MPKKKSLLSFFKRAENWVNMVALIITVALGYRSLTAGDTNSYLQAVLAVLGMLALGQLAVGYSSILRDRDIEELTRDVQSLSQDRLSSDSYFRTRKDLLPLDTVLSSATSTVDVLGLGLATLAITHQGVVRNRAESGVQFRLVLSNPDNEFVQDTISRGLLEMETADLHARLVRTAIENLKASAEQVGTGKLQVRVTDQVPPFSYFGVDTMMPEGEISVELYLAKTPLGKNPIFILDPAKDSHWYREFRNQFEFFWSQSKEIDIDPNRLAGDSQDTF